MGNKEKFLRKRREEIERLKYENRPMIDDDACQRIYEAAAQVRLIQKQLQLLLASELDEDELRDELETLQSAIGYAKMAMMDKIYLDPITDETSDEPEVDRFLDDLVGLEGVRSFNERMERY